VRPLNAPPTPRVRTYVPIRSQLAGQRRKEQKRAHVLVLMCSHACHADAVRLPSHLYGVRTYFVLGPV
jgi:glycerol-3-phosphate O-acyltransferase